MTTWRLAKALAQLRKQIDDQSPERSRASDGSIGDAAHQKVKSEHNPNPLGVVTALDITHDPNHGVDMNVIAEQVIRDSRVWYIIWNRRIRYYRGPWQSYEYAIAQGNNPHEQYMHISADQDASNYDNPALWSLGNVKGESMSNVTISVAEHKDLLEWKQIGLRYRDETIPKMEDDKQAWVERATKAESGQAHLDRALKQAYEELDRLKQGLSKELVISFINEHWKD